MPFNATFDVDYTPNTSPGGFSHEPGGIITIKPHGAYKTQTFAYRKPALPHSEHRPVVVYHDRVTGTELDVPKILAMTPEMAIGEAMVIAVTRLTAERAQLGQELVAQRDAQG